MENRLDLHAYISFAVTTLIHPSAFQPKIELKSAARFSSQRMRWHGQTVTVQAPADRHLPNCEQGALVIKIDVLRTQKLRAMEADA
jgi:hypothetical protein